jgi:hypothetical protein
VAHRGAVAAGRGLLCRSEPEQMTALDIVEQKCAGQRLEDVGGGAADPALLEPDDIVDADVDELGELLPPQAGDAAAGARVEAGQLRRDAGAPRPHELAQLIGAGHGPIVTDPGTHDPRMRAHWMRRPSTPTLGP